jgi:bifunctional ADP-heptose synthase (sugar kinase/adenylyltransferase)
MNDAPLTETEDADLRAWLHDNLPNYDVVITVDYGHGMLSPATIEVLCTEAPFLAVNTQSNAGNHGFNLISRYPRADYICLAQREFALETRTRRLSPEAMIRHVAESTCCSRIVMTQGKYGCIVHSAPKDFRHTPALAVKVVDRVGAGDAVFCLSSLCVASGANDDVLGFIANVVGAQAVNIMGNQRSIERIPLYRHIECLLKVHSNDREKDGTRSTPTEPALAS